MGADLTSDAGARMLRARLAEAATLHERLDGVVHTVVDPASDARCERWREILHSDAGPAPPVLALRGLTFDSPRTLAALGRASWSSEAPLPRWATDVLELTDGMRNRNRATERLRTRGRSSERGQTLRDVLAPVVDYVADTVPALWSPEVAGDARRGLVQHLDNSLFEVSHRVLALELQLSCQADGTALAAPLRPPPTADAEWSFAEELLRDGFGTLLAEYPVLGRLWVSIAADWRDMVTELLARADQDASGLAARLGAPRRGALLSVAAARSDRHHGGRMVWMLDFDAGPVVYKPRDMALEAAWAGLLTWLEAHGSPIQLRAPWTWPRGGYGWQELADHAACPPAEVGDFYQRAGALLCLAHALSAGDCHRDNVVASGPHPVLVDLETLLGSVQRGASDDEPAAQSEAADLLAGSVLGTGLLPHWSPIGDGAGIDLAGLDSYGADLPAFSAEHVWFHEQAPGHARRPPLRVAPLPNLVRTPDGTAQRATSHVQDVLTGFRTMRSFLAEQRDAICGAAGPLAPFRGGWTRVIHRPTTAYAQLLHRSLTPTSLRHGAERDIALEALRSTAAWHDVGDEVVESEQQALRRLDIPRLGRRSDETPDWPGAPAPTGWDEVRQRFSDLTASDGLAQVELARMAFLARATEDVLVPPHTPAVEPAESVWDGSDCRDDLLATAERIADLVCRSGISGDDGTVTWVVPHGGLVERGFGVRPAGVDLYSGLSGTGVFLAAASAMLDHGPARTMASRVARSLTMSPVESAPGVGGVMGLGSVVWGLTVMGELLRDVAMVEEAARWARAITEDAVASDEALDLAAGSAGAVLGLLRLHAAAPDDELLAAANRCADHLIERRTGSPASCAGPNGRRLAGLAHGAAGMALALFRLHAVTGQAHHLEAALEATAYERTLFDARIGTWRDLRDGAEDGPAINAWCNGAAGIGIARGEWVDLDADLAWDHAAAVATLARPERGLDHLCCGALGRVELLLSAGLHTGDEGLVQTARGRAAAVVRRADRNGDFRLAWYDPINVQHAGLFRGTSGIGYELLRLALPTRVPSVLALE